MESSFNSILYVVPNLVNTSGPEILHLWKTKHDKQNMKNKTWKTKHEKQKISQTFKVGPMPPLRGAVKYPG